MPSLYKLLLVSPKGITLSPEEHHVKKLNDIDHVIHLERPGWQSKAFVSTLGNQEWWAGQEWWTEGVGVEGLLATVTSPQPLCRSDLHAHACLLLSSLQHL